MSDQEYYSILSMASVCYYNAGREDSAIITGEGAVKYFEKIKAFDDPLYNTLLGYLGLCYEYYEEYTNAINTYEKCIPFFTKNYGAANERTLNYSLRLAQCYSANSEYKKALALNRNIRRTILSAGLQQSTEHIAVLTNIGNDFLQLGRNDSARFYQEESLSFREKLFGKQHTQYAVGLSNLGLVFQGDQKYPEAIFNFQEAKRIFENNRLDSSADYTTLLLNLGSCYCYLDNYLLGTELMLNATGIIRETLGPYNIRFVTAVQKVASAYVEAGGENNVKDAIGFYRYAKSIMEQLKAERSYLNVSLLTGLGSAYSYTPKKDSALYFFQHAAILTDTLQLTGTANYAMLLSRIASLFSDNNEHTKAIVYYQRSLAILRGIYGDSYPSMNAFISNLALAYYKKGDHAIADSLFKQTFALNRNIVLNNTEGLSEEEKEGFAISIKGTSFLAADMRLNKQVSFSADWIYNSILFYKGLLLEGSKGMIRAFNKLSDPGLQKKVQEYLNLKAYIGKELLKPLNSRDSLLRQSQAKATDLERILLKASAEYRHWKEQFDLSAKDLQFKLKANEASVEFINYFSLKDGYFDKENGKYAALITKKNGKDAALIYLFSENDLRTLFSKGSTEAIVKKLYRSTIKSVSASQPTAADSLYHLIWKPLLPYLEGIETIYFSSDGVMNNLNLAAIITPEGKRLVEQYEFIQLSSTRNIIKTAMQPSFKEMHLWGGVDYNGGAGSSANRSDPFSYLPGTLSEVNSIASSASGKAAVTRIVSNEASEALFKKFSHGSPEVLHIATHGFFFPDPEVTPQYDSNRFAMASNPLLRSGLVLAEANNNWITNTAGNNKDDGILTAYEIANMDLSATKLVVLSACETGLGDIKSGEGVYGLQRAFKLAGVNYIIMSLWQVPDLETQEFMQLLYAKCFAGLPLRKAFRETQLEMNKKYQPYQWAAFVLVE